MYLLKHPTTPYFTINSRFKYTTSTSTSTANGITF